MSKRLQVVMNDAELRAYERAARAQKVPLSVWVRQALRTAYQTDPRGSPDQKLARIRAAAKHTFPAPEIDEMLAEIERGYGQGSMP
jgi:hypothetical protein